MYVNYSEELRVWAIKFGVKVNPSKCQAIMVGSRLQLDKVDIDAVPLIKFDNYVINFH